MTAPWVEFIAGAPAETLYRRHGAPTDRTAVAAILRLLTEQEAGKRHGDGNRRIDLAVDLAALVTAEPDPRRRGALYRAVGMAIELAEMADEIGPLVRRLRPYFAVSEDRPAASGDEGGAVG